MWKQGMLALGAALLLQVPFATAQAQVLATLRADVTGDRAPEKVELQGDPLTEGNTYFRNLLVVVRKEKGDLLGAWTPDLNGGYDCVLQAVPAGGTGKASRGKERILLLAGRNRSGGAVDGRLLDWTNPKKPVVEFRCHGRSGLQGTGLLRGDTPRGNGGQGDNAALWRDGAERPGGL